MHYNLQGLDDCLLFVDQLCSIEFLGCLLMLKDAGHSSSTAKGPLVQSLQTQGSKGVPKVSLALPFYWKPAQQLKYEIKNKEINIDLQHSKLSSWCPQGLKKS